MKYTPAALQLLGYHPRSNSWKDFVTYTMQTWFKFSQDHSVSEFAWYNNKYHRNTMNVTHGGALMTFMDQCMSATIWDLTGGQSAYTMQLDNKFVHPARLDRWIFCQVRPVEVGDTIKLEGEIHVNEPNGHLVLKSSGEFTLPKKLKVLDNTK